MIIFSITSGLAFMANVFHYRYKVELENVPEASINLNSTDEQAYDNRNNEQIQHQNSTQQPSDDSFRETRKIFGYLEHSKGFLEAFSLLWLFFGCAWVFSCKTCKITAPVLYYSSITCILYGYMMICVPLILFSVIVCVVPTAFLLVKQVRQQKLQREAKKILKTIPLMPYNTVYEERYGARNDDSELGSSSTIDSTIDCCSICLSGFRWKEKVRRLACKHYFHQKCGDKWLLVHGTCPLCLSSINTV